MKGWAVAKRVPLNLLTDLLRQIAIPTREGQEANNKLLMRVLFDVTPCSKFLCLKSQA